MSSSSPNSAKSNTDMLTMLSMQNMRATERTKALEQKRQHSTPSQLTTNATSTTLSSAHDDDLSPSSSSSSASSTSSFVDLTVDAPPGAVAYKPNRDRLNLNLQPDYDSSSLLIVTTEESGLVPP